MFNQRGPRAPVIFSAAMLKQFYEKLLPTQGNYCIGGIDKDERIYPTFARDLDGLEKAVEKFKSKNYNVYVTPATFKGTERKQKDALFIKSLFLDLDVREGASSPKHYESKDAAIKALADFVEKAELPPPVRIDSGRGIQAYWIFDTAVPVEKWKPLATRFKNVCRELGLKIDPTVPADCSRFMRCPSTFNQKTNPPAPTRVLDGEINEYSFDQFVKHFEVEEAPPINEILAKVPKGLDEDMIQMKKLDNFEYVFQQIAERSLEGTGCAQIKQILTESSALGYERWTAGLTIAIKCIDGEEAVHLMSEDHPDYDRAKTLQKAKSFGGVYTCDWFREDTPELCEGCPHAGKIKSPIHLGKRLKEAEPEAVTPDAVREQTNPEDVFELPDYMYPFSRGVKGGIYYIPAPKITKDGKKIPEDPVMLFDHDVYPIRRMYSPYDGECMIIKVKLPQDPDREFVMPTNFAYKKDEFTKLMVSNGVTFNSSGVLNFMKYFEQWGRYLVNTKEADMMRTQFGWTEEKDAFVTGEMELRQDGTERRAATSPYVKKLSKLIRPVGDYDAWKVAVNKLNMPEFELHAFGLLCGFGSPLMARHPKVSGVSVSFTGKSGNGKTGAMYAGLSVFMNPKEGSVLEATDNGLTGRYLSLHSLLFGLDEVSNWPGDDLSDLVHKVSQGKAKIRMQGSVNAERELELSAALILLMTTNEPIADKLSGFKAYAGGELARAIEFNVRRPTALDLRPELGPEIFTSVCHNYGFAGPEFIKYCMKRGMTRVDSLMQHWITRFQKDYKYDPMLRFYEGLISTTFPAAELAAEAKIIDIDYERVYQHVLKNIITIAEDTVKAVDVDYGGLVSEFILAHHTGLLALDGGRVVAEPRTSIIGRSDVDEGITYISKTLFRQFLSERHVSSKEFEFAMKENGQLIEAKKQRLTSGWKAGFHAPPVAVYGFKFALPKELLGGPSED